MRSLQEVKYVGEIYSTPTDLETDLMHMPLAYLCVCVCVIDSEHERSQFQGE
jgi:hypothetical protein